MEQEKNKKLSELIVGKNKNSKLILICAVLAVIGLLFIFFADSTTAKKETPQSNVVFDSDAYNKQFVSDMEQKLTGFISQIDGVGNATVLVTLETGVQYVYATEGKETGDSSLSANSEVLSEKHSSETNLVIVDGQNGKEPVVLKRIEPTVQGVVVVCD